MEDCCGDLSVAIYYDGRGQTCPCRQSMAEDRNAGKQGKGTGRKMPGPLQTLVYLRWPCHEISIRS